MLYQGTEKLMTVVKRSYCSLIIYFSAKVEIITLINKYLRVVIITLVISDTRRMCRIKLVHNYK